MAARRLSNFFNKIGSPGNGNDPPPSDTNNSSSSSSGGVGSPNNRNGGSGGGDDISDNYSVTSDSTFSTNSDGKNDFFSFRFTSDPKDEDIDNGMKFLYGDPDILEKRCQYSSFGKRFDDLGDEVEDEGKLVDRFKHVHKKKISEVPEPYFQDTFDPVLQCLLEVQSWTQDNFSENFMNKMEDIDADRDIVSTELNSKIKANYDGLMECMRGVHAIDLDLSKAIIQVQGSRRKLKGAMDTTTQGPMRVVTAKHKRDELELIVERARGLKFIKDLFKTMVQNLTTGELGRAAEFSMSVLQNVNTHLYDDYTALKSISSEVQKNVYLIRQKTDKALLLLSERRFAANDYSNIINSYMVLDDLSENLQIDVSNQSSDDSKLDGEEYDRLNCIDALALRIQRFQMDDLESCLHKAVLTLIHEGQHRKQRTAKQVAMEGVVYDTLNQTAMMDLADKPIEDLYRHLTSDLIVPCIIRSCDLFTDVVHTHYLITQWHRMPFDERNNDINFLHRSSLSAFDQSVNNDSAIKHLQRNSSSSALTEEEISEKIKSQIDQLDSAYVKLCQSRSTLWDNLVTTFIDMLKGITLTSAISFEDFISMVWAINALIKLGTEFCNANRQSLVDCLEEKASEYFQTTLFTDFKFMHDSLELDPWTIFPVRISEYGSINKLIMSKVALTKNDSSLVRLVLKGEIAGMGCLKTKIRLDAEKERERKDKVVKVLGGGAGETLTTSESTQDDVSEQTQILMHFAVHGNPFRDHNKDANQPGLGGRDDGEDDANVHANANAAIPLHEDLVSKSMDISSIINDIFNEDISSPVSKRAQANNDTIVVTQSILNGLAKYCGKYLQIINIMPCVASDAFQGLRQLFDFYLCFVFHGFVSPEERAKFLAKYSKMTLPAPDLGRDFETLLSYLEKALNESYTVPFGGSALPSGFSSSSSGVGAAKRGLGGSGDGDDEIGGTAGAEGNAEKMQDFASLLRLPSNVEFDDEATYFGLINRIVAGESCWFAAKILVDIKPRLLRCLPAQLHSQCEQYITQFQVVASQLRSLINKSMCPLLIHQSWLLQQITDRGGWDSKKLQDSHHDYIDSVVEYCQQAWDFMDNDRHFGDASPIVREQVWLELCQCAFDSLLDGFTRAKKLTPEGRASMYMDTTALHDGLDSIHACRTPRGKHHIDSYLHALQLPEEEMMSWVNENWQSYAYRHIYGLLTQTLTSILNPKRLRDAIAVIDSLYETDVKCVDSKVDENFNWQKIKDSTGGSISNITQKLRRQSMLGGGN